ncbi:sperm acrosome developmental regulator-like isoform X3 [Petaurus breviceps papuanus]|uniref:sperm acrosome developmental regulator-like isoform X3 n=1 Tax=Petaurus breviceps papuanus TaxID=3040969 RepID=UPI0036DE2124
MLAIGSPLDGDDDSGSGSMVAIDNKIEQAMTATSQPPSLGLPQYEDSKEAEMLRDLYVVLWTMRERICELVRRQERRKRRHSRPPTCTSSPRGSKQDARSPL